MSLISEVPVIFDSAYDFLLGFFSGKYSIKTLSLYDVPESIIITPQSASFVDIGDINYDDIEWATDWICPYYINCLVEDGNILYCFCPSFFDTVIDTSKIIYKETEVTDDAYLYFLDDIVYDFYYYLTGNIYTYKNENSIATDYYLTSITVNCDGDPKIVTYNYAKVVGWNYIHTNYYVLDRVGYFRNYYVGLTYNTNFYLENNCYGFKILDYNLNLIEIHNLNTSYIDIGNYNIVFELNITVEGFNYVLDLNIPFTFGKYKYIFEAKIKFIFNVTFNIQLGFYMRDEYYDDCPSIQNQYFSTFYDVVNGIKENLIEKVSHDFAYDALEKAVNDLNTWY